MPWLVIDPMSSMNRHPSINGTPKHSSKSIQRPRVRMCSRCAGTRPGPGPVDFGPDQTCRHRVAAILKMRMMTSTWMSVTTSMQRLQTGLGVEQRRLASAHEGLSPDWITLSEQGIKSGLVCRRTRSCGVWTATPEARPGCAC